MSPRAPRLLVMALAMIVTSLAPCFAAIPDARGSCPMAACPGAGGESFRALSPCCCSGSPFTPASESSPLLHSSSASVSAPDGTAAAAAGAMRVSLAPAGGDSPGAVDPVPLYLLHASLLI